MSVKFDAVAAEKLINQMDLYCSSLQQEATEILDILEVSGAWNDPQYHAFYEDMLEISRDLVKALELQSNYMQVFAERVAELRG